MTPQRITEILNEEIEKDSRIVTDKDIDGGVKLCLSRSALTAMQRAVEEETATLRAEVDRLKGFAVHMSNCAWRYNGNGVCTCGLDTPANG